MNHQAPIKQPRLTIVCLALLCGLWSLDSCSNRKPEEKTRSLTFYNASDRKVEIHKLEGLTMFEVGGGPQDMGEGGPHHPGVPVSFNTWSTIRVSLPIKLEWSYWEDDGTRSEIHEQQFPKIPGIEGDTIEEEAALVLMFGADGKWHLHYVPGKGHLTDSALDRMAEETRLSED